MSDAAPAKAPVITIGPANIDGRWHFAPVDVSIAEEPGAGVTVRSADTPAAGSGPDRKAAFRAWMIEVARRYKTLAADPAGHSPEQAKEWKWMQKIVQRMG